ncbi:rhodanese-like domain-containing protein [Neptuniibacter sp. QD37_6]|uniref:rhodanese-like domain-containing protein n=1 Tax=Neptuniibacter sp. QD37_6 TaxID=3398210 RepID=UPI0039F454E6
MLSRFKQSITVWMILLISPYLAAEQSNRVMITPELFSFVVEHEKESIEIKRNQNPDNTIHELYITTSSGTPQPMFPFEPYEVETIGEREFIEYLQQAQTDSSILIVDTRTEGWHYRLTIPGSTNIPYTLLKDPETLSDTLEELGAINKDGVWDFSQAKTIAAFCNGYWCGQTPTFIWALLELDYPEDKLNYYRGGMQAWTSLGLTTVGDYHSE